MVRDKIHQLLDRLPEEELDNVVFVLEFIEMKYLFKKNLREKGVVVSELFEEAQDLIDTWDRAFAENISEETKESIHYDEFKWHMFSYEKQDCLKEEEARAAFNAMPKDELYGMVQRSPSVFRYENAGKVLASDFDSEQDIYLFDMNLTWTYVHTHESDLGPYFFKRKENSTI
ncbi:DUF4275 family protein [Gorillibacterium timonense]|uniref:DUF4275 family protein n=1 Tax=Gorillibacterium timonense TaxID=1689269 RepID=UPI00071CD715|nr:DUF4275 family protein [Gorillibacterium timonense]